MLDTATVFAEVDGFTGTPVKFEVAGDVTVAEKAKLSADGRGWHWYERSTLDLTKFTTSQIHTQYNKTIVSVSLGCGTDYTVGGTYGLGEPTDTSSRHEFGYLYAPFLSGGACGGYDTSNRAGGQIWIETPGTLTLDGTVTAVPSTGGSTRSSSGGGIWLCAKKLAAGETAKLIANGGNSSGGSSTTAGGTGGRISVAIGVSAEDLVALAHGELPDGLAYSEDITACSTSVKGGEGQKVGGYMVYAPKGTVSTVIGEASEYDLRIMGSPLEAVQDGLEYHVEKVTVGSTWSQTLESFGYDPAAPQDVRYSLAGWVISNTTEEVARGTDATATFTVGKGPFTVTWLWNNRETLTRLTPNDPTLGGVSVNGGEATSTPDAWSSDAASITVRAVPNAGAEFLYWYGDVPFESATKETLTFDTAEPFGVLPVFRKVAEPTNYVWQVADGRTGNWEDAANWMPTNVPGPADTVTIASGTCVASNYAVCAALDLSGKGALKVGAAASTLLKEAVLVVSGDVTLTNSAALTVNDPYGSYLRHMRMTVGGNLTLMDKATLQLGAGPTNGVDITLATGGGGRISVCQFISPERADRMALDGEYHGVGKAAKHVFGRDEFRAAFNLPETAVNLSDGKDTEAEPYGGSFTYIDGTPSGLMLIAR